MDPPPAGQTLQWFPHARPPQGSADKAQKHRTPTKTNTNTRRCLRLEPGDRAARRYELPSLPGRRRALLALLFDFKDLDFFFFAPPPGTDVVRARITKHR